MDQILLCDYCPYMCLAKQQLTAHVNDVHPSRKPIDICELKCPACPNLFFQTKAFESHLTHDHLLQTEDLEKMMQNLQQPKSVSYTRRDPCNVENVRSIETLLVSNAKVISSEECVSVNQVKQAKESEKLLELTGIVNDPLTNEISFEDKTLEGHVVNKLPTANNDNQHNKEDVDHTDSSSKDSHEDSQVEPVSTLGGGSFNQHSENETQNVEIYSRSYISEKLYKCKIANCRTQMKDITKLEYHTKCHSKNKFACPEHNCKTTYALWKSLVAHLWRIHKVDMELFKCDLCDYRTHSYSKLATQHRATHGEERRFKCDHDNCDKAFKNNKQLRNHKDAVHKEQGKSCTDSGTSMFRCKECDKPFVRRRQMKFHMDTVHKKIKSHVCSFCGYYTSSRGALNMHVRIHTGEKPFKCEDCDYSSADHNSLRRHKLRHGGDKPYKCPHCDYECIQSSTYKMHVKMKHPTLNNTLLFSCPLCNFHSVNNVVYTGHLYSQHPQYAEKNISKTSKSSSNC